MQERDRKKKVILYTFSGTVSLSVTGVLILLLKRIYVQKNCNVVKHPQSVKSSRLMQIRFIYQTANM